MACPYLVGRKIKSEVRKMSMIRYEPWSLFDQLRRELETSMGSRSSEDSSIATSDWVPAVDIKENDDNFVIMADIPGVKPEDIEVQMDNGMLTIKGQRETESKEEKDDYKRVERHFGSFYRRFSLPDTANPEQVVAESDHGVLKITIGKQVKHQPRRIEVTH
jgi:HSP20 family protein